MSQFNRKKIADGVHFSWIVSEKFKHNRLAIHCIMPLDIATASENAVVPLMLRKGSKDCPDFSLLNIRLNHLYGAVLSTGVSRFNKYQSMGISMRTLANKYALKDEDILLEGTKLLSDLFFNPNINEKGEFAAKELELEKQYLIDRIKGEIDDKRSYAIARCMEEMYEGEGVATPRFGTLETAKAITPKSAGDAWRRMINTASIEIIFTGSADHSAALALMQEKFSQLEREPIKYSVEKLRDIAEVQKDKTEEIEGLSQGKLVMGFRIKGLKDKKQRDAARVFSAIYGGTPFSKLFLNVREKLSLCYYCAARVDSTNNLLLVDSGVENENREKAQQEILHQLDLVKQGEISTDELENTKLLLLNSLKGVGDSLSGLESWYLSQILLGENTSPQEDIENLCNVTAAEIVEVANGISLDTVYFLKGGEEEQ